MKLKMGKQSLKSVTWKENSPERASRILVRNMILIFFEFHFVECDLRFFGNACLILAYGFGFFFWREYIFCNFGNGSKGDEIFFRHFMYSCNRKKDFFYICWKMTLIHYIHTYVCVRVPNFWQPKTLHSEEIIGFVRGAIFLTICKNLRFIRSSIHNAVHIFIFLQVTLLGTYSHNLIVN